MSRRKVRLYLTGPEMSGKDGEVKRKRPGAEEGQEQEEDVSNDCMTTRGKSCLVMNPCMYIIVAVPLLVSLMTNHVQGC